MKKIVIPMGMIAIVGLSQNVFALDYGTINNPYASAYYQDGSYAKKLNVGDVLGIVGKVEEKQQYIVKINGEDAIIAMENADVIKVTDTAPRGTIVRNKPDPNASILVTMNGGTEVSILNKVGAWYEVRLASGELGYVYGEQLAALTCIEKLPEKKYAATEVIQWSKATNVLARGKVATVEDVKTGKTFQVKRTYGTNNADVEALTAADTQVMKEISGGFSWERRPVIVTVDGRRLAASIAIMPHGGKTLNQIKNNNMNGVVDLHFQGSKRHAEGNIKAVVDPQHQAAINIAAQY